MARIIENKYPLDLDARKIIGFGFPLSGDAVFIPTFETKNQIKANLINYLLTNKGERLFNPDFGADLRNLIFNAINIEEQNELKDIIQDSINSQFPEIVVNTLTFDNDVDNNTIHLILMYSIKGFGVEDNIKISIN